MPPKVVCSYHFADGASGRPLYPPETTTYDTLTSWVVASVLLVAAILLWRFARRAETSLERERAVFGQQSWRQTGGHDDGRSPRGRASTCRSALASPIGLDPQERPFFVMRWPSPTRPLVAARERLLAATAASDLLTADGVKSEIAISEISDNDLPVQVRSILTQV